MRVMRMMGRVRGMRCVVGHNRSVRTTRNDEPKKLLACPIHKIWLGGYGGFNFRVGCNGLSWGVRSNCGSAG
jgi:hypothetical protein